MVTSKLVSNIYYGSGDHLKMCLNRLVEDGSLAWWCYCEHFGERQYNPVLDQWEGNRDKNHIHVGIKPNKRLNLDVVYANCMQLVEGRVTGFTRNWQFERSNFDFWLYLFHDKDYLAAKQMVREYNYSESNIVCSDDDIKAYELFRAREEFWAQHGIKSQVLRVVKGQMSEADLFAHNIRNAYGVDKLLKAARREVLHEINKENGDYRRLYVRQVGML